MARKDQKKFFFLACLHDEPFVAMFKGNKIPFGCWAYINAIRKRRDKLRNYLYANFKGDLQKQLKATSNKAEDFFRKMPYSQISCEHYISFLLGLGEDILVLSKDNTEKEHLDKIVSHLFSLYQKFDPELEGNEEIEKALKDLQRIEEYF